MRGKKEEETLDTELEESKDQPKKISQPTLTSFSGKNFSFMFGCKPDDGVKAETKFIADIIRLYNTHFDPEKGEISIPDIFSNDLSSDADFEFTTHVDAKKLLLKR